MDSILEFIKNLRNNFSALTHRDFRIFWFGQMISLIGTWMQNISMPWIAYSLTKSPVLLGLVGAFQFLPVLLFSIFAGAVIDKINKRKLIIITQIAQSIAALVMAILVISGEVAYWHILIVSFLIGISNTLDMPARQSFMIELVGKKDLMNAIALNSSVFNAARIVGPALAALFMGLFGAGFCFLTNSISFIPVIISLFFIKTSYSINDNQDKNNIIDNILAGIKYIKNNKILLQTLALVFVMGTFAMNFNVLVPVFAKTILDKGETGFGLLMSAMGIGSLSGAIVMTIRSKSGPKKIMLLICAVSSSVLLALIGITNIFVFTAITLAFTGFSNVSFFTTANSLLQLNSEDKYRGRVLSFYTLLFGGSTPFGNMFSGFITDKFGVRIGFIASGTCIILLVLLLMFIKNKKDY